METGIPNNFVNTDSSREEWKEFFSEGVYSVLLRFFVKLSQSEDLNCGDDSLLFSIGNSLHHIPEEQLIEHQLEPK